MTPFVPANRLYDAERRERRDEYWVVVTRSLTDDREVRTDGGQSPGDTYRSFPSTESSKAESGRVNSPVLGWTKSRPKNDRSAIFVPKNDPITTIRNPSSIVQSISIRTFDTIKECTINADTDREDGGSR